MNIEYIKSVFEEDFATAPFTIDFTKDDTGEYVDPLTLKYFTQYAIGYFDGYTDVNTTNDIAH